MLLRHFLQLHGYSRRKILWFIQQGTLFVDEQRVDSLKKELSFGQTVRVEKKNYMYTNSPTEYWLVLFHKPLGYVCSHKDFYNKTIYELLPEKYATYRYIGRLDKDSTWLVLLTNYLSLVDRWSHPRYMVEKEYVVSVNSAFSLLDKEKMLRWIQDDGDLLSVKSITIVDKQIIRIVLTEWKNRHIRRMLTACGYDVVWLIRIREWSYSLNSLTSWAYTVLSLDKEDVSQEI